MKHVIASANNYISVEDNTTNIENNQHSKDTPITTPTPNSATKVDEKNFQECCYRVFI